MRFDGGADEVAGYFDTDFDAPEMESVAQLAQKMVYRLPGCDNETILLTLREAFADFARLSSCFTTWRDVPLEARRSRYPVCADIPGMAVSAVSEVRIDGRVMSSPEQYAISAGKEPVIVLAPYLVPRIVDDSAPPQVMSVRAVELPKIGSLRAPSWFVQKFGDAVAAGAMVKLLGMGGKPWSDEAQMQQELVRYENFLSGARLDSMRGDGSPFGSGHIDVLDTSDLL